ncbi:MAG: hypothetical protein V7707_06760 [Motiliproteus sp.]
MKKMTQIFTLTTAAAIAFTGQTAAADQSVIELTQTPCQFLESESGVDHQFTSANADDCKTINSESADERLAKIEPIVIKPGRYTFRVTNKNVSYPLGFWLRGKGVIGRATLPSVSGGGLTTGTTKDYQITLKPGEYYYSCPLNPTLDYTLIVES